MRITGYRKPTEKEHDYLMIHHLFRKHGIPTTSIDSLLDILSGELCSDRAAPDQLVQFHFIRGCSQMCIIHLDDLPENTTRLIIETK